MLREIASTEIYTVLLVVCLLLVAIAKLLFSKRFQDFIELLFNFRYIKGYLRNQKFLDVFEGLLFINAVIGLSIFSLISYTKRVDLELTNHFNIFKLVFIIAAVIIIKTVIEGLISRVLNINQFINEYIFVKTSYKNFLGLLLIPINGLLLFTLNLTDWIIISFVILLLLINCIGIFFYIKGNLNLIKNNLFYFILYLCALEISPYFILYKLIT